MPSRKTVAVAVAVAVAVTATAAAAPTVPRPRFKPPSRLHIVATLPDLAAMASDIVGDRGQVSALLSPSADPFVHDPHPDESLLLSRADLLIAGGGPMEAGWLPRLILSSHNPRLGEYLDVGRLLSQLPPKEREDLAGSYPLSDPRSMQRAAQSLALQLGALDEASAPAYRHAATLFMHELLRRERLWLTQLAPLRGLKVVSYDDTFSSFLRWAGLVEVAILSPAPGMPPSPSSAMRALRLMRTQDVRLILQREYQPAHTVRLLREKTGAQVVVAPLGARSQRGERYMDALDQLVQALLSAHRTARSASQP